MTISERSVGGVTILDIDGQLTIGAASGHLRDKVRSVLQQGQKRLVLNLAGVHYVDSGGLGEMVQAYATTKTQGGALKLVNTTKRLHDLLVITKLSTVFDTFDTEAAAIASFGASE